MLYKLKYQRVINYSVNTNYIYEFYVGDKTYEGNSLVDERDSSKIGTKIQILYLDWLPWFNRPIYYWDD